MSKLYCLTKYAFLFIFNNSYVSYNCGTLLIDILSAAIGIVLIALVYRVIFKSFSLAGPAVLPSIPSPSSSRFGIAHGNVLTSQPKTFALYSLNSKNVVRGFRGVGDDYGDYTEFSDEELLYNSHGDEYVNSDVTEPMSLTDIQEMLDLKIHGPYADRIYHIEEFFKGVLEYARRNNIKASVLSNKLKDINSSDPVIQEVIRREKNTLVHEFVKGRPIDNM